MTNPEIGHNNPPAEIDPFEQAAQAVQDNTVPADPIDAIKAKYKNYTEEAQNWLDGDDVVSEIQMEAVDSLLKEMKAAKKEMGLSEKEHVGPKHLAWQAEKARFKKPIETYTLICNGLAAAMTKYKVKIAAEKEEIKRKAYAESNRLAREAEEAAAAASKTDIVAQEAAADAKAKAIEAKKKASAASQDKVTGLRTVKTAAVTDYDVFFAFLQKQHPDDVRAWLDGRATGLMNAGETLIAGVKITETQKGF